MHSGADYPSEVIMSRCQGRRENFVGTPLWLRGSIARLVDWSRYPAEDTLLRCPTSPAQAGGRAMHTPQPRPPHLHGVTRRALLRAGFTASVTLAMRPLP